MPEYLNLSMRDQVDSDITLFVYSVVEYIENALEKNKNAKILVHCFKVDIYDPVRMIYL